MRKISLLILTLLLVGAIAQAQEETPQGDGVSVTVYNQGSALVQDRRTFDLQVGETTINFTDVAASIDATSVSFNSLTDPEGTYVIEQNYVYDLVDSYALLERYLDQTIQVTAEDGTVYTGQLLSGRTGDIILRKDDGQVVVINISNTRDIQFPNLPDGLITRPTLRWQVYSATGGAQQVELTYLTGGMSWTADYTVLLANDNSQLDLNGWITLTNQSGTAYENAKLKLIAGDVNRLPDPNAFAREEAYMAMDAMAASAPASVEQRDFSEYKLYEVPRPVTVGNNETKQVQFVTGADVPATTFYVYNSSPSFYNYGYILEDQYYGQTGVTDVQNYLEFKTDEEGGVGAALPAGRVRVYQEDIDGSALLIGENSIEHTPKGETVQMYLGNAFDLVGERIQTSYNAIAGNVIQETYQITLKNRKEDQAVEIRVPENLFRWSNWQILESSQPYTQIDSNSIEFRVNVEPMSDVVITYTVQYTWPR
jgi:hypothetical protein